MSRLTTSISFKSKTLYDHVKKQPNSSHYINELIRKDIEEEKRNTEYIDKKIEELKKYIDTKGEKYLNSDLKNNLMNFF